MKITNVEDMPVYRAFYELALKVERISRKYGSDFRWLRNQSLRSSESVCANLTEGFYSQYSTEYVQALHRGRREARETVTHLRYGTDAGQLLHAEAEGLFKDYESALRQLSGLIASIERKALERGKAKPGWGAVREEDAEGEGEVQVDPPHFDHQPLTISHRCRKS
ncbi:MAG: four helix bundle protein [Verrucomicrobia bacterium]|nr:four helix bundle protein [Verrucomicrobiota bacterium]